jgi:glycosyltransferase involved in cell wall biosynthesis
MTDVPGQAVLRGEVRSGIVAALAMPPPVTGASMVSQRVIELLRRHGARVKLVDISPRQQRRSIVYHFRRLVRVCQVPFVLAARAWSGPRAFYMTVDAGYGMVYTIAICLAARVMGYRIFLHHHAGSVVQPGNGLFKVLCGVVGPDATHIVLSASMARDLQTQYGARRRTVIAHNAAYIDEPDQAIYPAVRPQLALGFLSNLSLAKGLDTVLDIVARVRASGIDAILYLAGPVTDPDASDLIDAAQRTLGGGIIRLGPVSGESKAQFFRDTDIFLFASRYKIEAQPLVVLEALSYGVPAIVTPQGYTGELVEPLGTVAEHSQFGNFVLAYVQRWTREADFGPAQRAAAHRRFISLRDDANLQLTLLADLMTLPAGNARTGGESAAVESRARTESYDVR